MVGRNSSVMWNTVVRDLHWSLNLNSTWISIWATGDITVTCAIPVFTLSKFFFVNFKPEESLKIIETFLYFSAHC